MMNVIRSFWT